MKYNVLMVGTDINTKGGIASVVRDYIDSGILKRLDVRYVPSHKDGHKITKALFYLMQLPKIFFGLFQSKLVHLHTSQGWSYRRLFIVLIMAKLLGKKVILHVHGSQFDKYFESAGFFEKKAICWGLRASSRVIALSDDWNRKLSEYEPKAKVITVFNGVDVSKYINESRIRHKQFTILFLGRLGERKGAYDLVKALDVLKHKNIHAILAGDGEIDDVRKLTTELGIDKWVDVPGWVDLEKKKELLKCADLYVLPSYNEGLPISVLEAIASGLPVISTPVGGIPHAVQEGVNGLLIEPGNVEALSHAMSMLLNDDDMWKKMSSASNNIAKNDFSMNVVESRIQAIYQDLLQDSL